jgi:CCR4-NOT complex subunit CAF16
MSCLHNQRVAHVLDVESTNLIKKKSSTVHRLVQKLTSSGELAYLGHQWRRSVASAGADISMQGDLSARQLIFNVPDVEAQRRDRLVKLLDINLSWRMHQVSDGQRRRVQICMGLLKPFTVLLLDEARSS